MINSKPMPSKSSNHGRKEKNLKLYSIQFNEVVRYEKFKFDPNLRLPNTKHDLYSDAHAVLEVAKWEYKSGTEGFR